MRKIVITGPESTGKTTLARQLADHFNVQPVPEFARSFLEQLGRPYMESDLVDIAKGQLALSQKPEYKKEPVQICDTGFLVLKIWSEFKYGRCHPWILEQFQLERPDLYLLCDIDLSWSFDPFRENPHQSDREELMNRYLSQLEMTGMPYEIVSGQGEERFKNALLAIG